MYYYNSYEYRFSVNNAVRFDVYNPSAAKTFDIFGTPSMGVVKKIKLSSNEFWLRGINATLRPTSKNNKLPNALQNYYYKRIPWQTQQLGVLYRIRE